jgi:hypothetical protein
MRNCSQAVAAAATLDKAASAASWTRLVLSKADLGKLSFTVTPNTARKDYLRMNSERGSYANERLAIVSQVVAAMH